MRGSEEHKSTVAVAVFFGLREQCIASDNDRGLIRGTTARLRYSACMRTVEAEEFRESAGCVLFDQSENWRHLVDVHLREDRSSRGIGDV